MLSASLSVLVVGFGLGLMHALDADHVMAVSAMANQKPSKRRSLRFCVSWALGHSGVLLACGLLLFGLGVQVPDFLQRGAELFVGVLLIGLGLFCYWQFRRNPITIKQHQHGDIVHSHLHVDGDVTHKGHLNSDGDNGHGPMLVGLVHGLAGSAPALALVPAVTQGQLTVAVVYLLLFSVGVMLSMLVFGFGFGALQEKLRAKHAKLFNYQRQLIALASILMGGYWLHQAL